MMKSLLFFSLTLCCALAMSAEDWSNWSYLVGFQIGTNYPEAGVILDVPTMCTSLKEGWQGIPIDSALLSTTEQTTVAQRISQHYRDFLRRKVALASMDPPQQAQSSTLTVLPKDASLVLGHQTGAHFGPAERNWEFSPRDACNGFSDAHNSLPSRLTAEEQAVIEQGMSADFQNYQARVRQAMLDANLQESLQWLSKNAENPDVVSLPSGLQYKVLQKGDGTSRFPTMADSVNITRFGWTKDYTYFGKAAETNVYPMTEVLRGWQEGLQLMKEGDRFEFYIPPALAYGENRWGKYIKENQAVVFDITLNAIIPSRK